MAAGPGAEQAGTAADNPATFHPSDPGETPVTAPQIAVLTYGQHSENITVSSTTKTPKLIVHLSIVSLKYIV